MSVISEGGPSVLSRIGLPPPGSRPGAAARGWIRLAALVALAALAVAACFAIRAALMRASAPGSTVVPKAFVRDGRTIVLPSGTVFLSNLRLPGAAEVPSPPMHAMITMRAAAAKAAMAGASPAQALANAAEAVTVAAPPPAPVPPRPKPVAGPNGFETLPAEGG